VLRELKDEVLCEAVWNFFAETICHGLVEDLDEGHDVRMRRQTSQDVDLSDKRFLSASF